MAIDYYKLKRARLRDIRGQETINQVEHVEAAGAKLMMGGVLVPGDLLTDDTSSAPRLVGGGNLLRIEVGSTTYIAFDDVPANLATVDATTTPALKLAAGVWLVAATGDFVKTSAAATRIEVIQLP